MVSNYHTLSWIASDLSRKFHGSRIHGAYSQEKDQLVLEIGNPIHPLVLDCRTLVNTLYLHPTQKRARRNTADVLRDSVGDTIISCTIHPSDRELYFALQSGKRIVARFFGSKANVFIVDQNELVTDAFVDAREFVGTQMKHRPEEELQIVFTDFLSDSSGSIGAYLKTSIPTLGAPLVEEVLCRSGVNRSQPLRQLSDENRELISNSYTEILNDLKDPRPRVYYDESSNRLITPVRFSPIDLQSCRLHKERQFDDMYDAMRFFLFGSRKASVIQGELQRMVQRLEKGIEKDKRAIAKIEKDLLQTAREEEYRSAGTIILANLHEIRRGSKMFEPKHPDSTGTIKLDAALTPALNAQKYFEKAKEAKVAYKQSHARLQHHRRRTVIGSRLLNSVTKISSREELKDFMNDNIDDAILFGLGGTKGTSEKPMFREFTVDEGFLVLAGKSSANNDLLTMKHAKPNDLWFHARGSSGSHVVLRVRSGTGVPGRRAKEQAASIAAYYSKMRNAKHVPVAMTEKKYVRKPKGAAKGSVSIERETVLIVTPGLPKQK